MVAVALVLPFLFVGVTAVPCVANDGSTGTLDCGGACLTAANCALSVAGYTTCEDWYVDVTCDDGSFNSDDGTKPNFNCPAYACDLNACPTCGTDPSYGTCGTDYSCGSNGACGSDGCVCNPGYIGFTCEYGVGVCNSQFTCGNGGTCGDGLCSCPAGYTGHDCSVALSMTIALPHLQLQALTDLFHTTGGYAWQINSGWLSSTDPCDSGPKGLSKGFNRIICDESGNVKELWLSSNKLRNAPPKSLTNLPSLDFLNLAGNSMTGFLDNSLSDLLKHKDMRFSLVGNSFYCPLPVSLRPLVGGSCVDAGLSLKNVTPSEALAFDDLTVTIYADVKGGAAVLADYPELRVRMTKSDGDVSYLQVAGAVGNDGFSVVIPGSPSAQNVTLALMHSSSNITNTEVTFNYLECAPGKFKGVDSVTLEVSCEPCPVNSYCINNRQFECPAGLYTESTGAAECIQEADDATTVIIVALAVFVGLFFGGSGIFFGRKFYIQYKQAILAQKEQHDAKVNRLQAAAKATTTVQFSVCLVPFTAFEKYHKLICHEEARQRGDIITLDTYGHVLAFCNKFPTVFISHQWLGFDEPDPENVHYYGTLEVCRHLIAKHKLDPSTLYIWFDYLSIPQRNPTMQALSIKSLGVYSSFARFFVIMAPPCRHHDKQTRCDKDSYQRRGWTRLEQWARMTRFGTDDMYMYDGSNGPSGDLLEPIKDQTHWYEESIKVFDGDYTYSEDKIKQVDTILGLWCHAVKNHSKKTGKSSEQIYELVMRQKNAVFPRAQFGDLIDTLEESLVLPCVLECCEDAPTTLPPLPPEIQGRLMSA